MSKKIATILELDIDNPYVEVGQEITYEINDRGSIKIQREGGGFAPKQSFKKDSRVELSIGVKTAMNYLVVFNFFGILYITSSLI